MAQNAPAPSNRCFSQELTIVLPSSVRCRYKNRFCNNYRATKDNGELHSLCEEHRAKANQNQQRLRDNHRQRVERLLRQARASESAAEPGLEDEDIEIEFEPLDSNADGSLSPSDWQEIAELWTDEEDSNSTEDEHKHGN